MAKNFDVYKWRRDQLSEGVDMGPENRAIYNEIINWMKTWNIDVKEHILNDLPSAIQRGLIASKRENINEDLRGSWVDRKGTFNGKEYDGYFKTIFRGNDSEIKDAIKAKGYTFIGDEDWDDPDRKTEYWYYYSK
jgi:hypothetical protein